MALLLPMLLPLLGRCGAWCLGRLCLLRLLRLLALALALGLG